VKKSIAGKRSGKGILGKRGRKETDKRSAGSNEQQKR